MRAGFLSLRFDSPMWEFVNRAELKEICESDFNLRKGSRVGSDDVSGMGFWWMKLATPSEDPRSREMV